MIIKINMFTRRLCDQAQKLFAIKKNCQKSAKGMVAAGGGSGFATLAKDDKKGRIIVKNVRFEKDLGAVRMQKGLSQRKCCCIFLLDCLAVCD